MVPARKLWDHIVSAQIETGTPYMLYKDSCNCKSNQQNLGTIACSNLCTEIIEYCDADEVAITIVIYDRTQLCRRYRKVFGGER